MTDDDKALVEQLAAEADNFKVAREVDMRGMLYRAADRIEALSAEIERLREALEKISKPCSVVVEPSGRAGEGWKKMYYGWRKIAVDRVDIARAALGETK